MDNCKKYWKIGLYIIRAYQEELSIPDNGEIVELEMCDISAFKSDHGGQKYRIQQSHEQINYLQLIIDAYGILKSTAIQKFHG